MLSSLQLYQLKALTRSQGGRGTGAERKSRGKDQPHAPGHANQSARPATGILGPGDGSLYAHEQRTGSAPRMSWPRHGKVPKHSFRPEAREAGRMNYPAHANGAKCPLRVPVASSQSMPNA
jgi:hypothetical protein